eukprot:scaffold8717_cov167-Amphora_coffeaeformis.AAC.9
MENKLTFMQLRKLDRQRKQQRPQVVLGRLLGVPFLRSDRANESQTAPAKRGGVGRRTANLVTCVVCALGFLQSIRTNKQTNKARLFLYQELNVTHFVI